MTSRLKVIFPDDWEHILSFYKGFICSDGTQKTDEGLLLTLLEIGVGFGERLSTIDMNGFIEIGCGRKTIEMFKKSFNTIMADRVRHTAFGFWEKMGFVRREEGDYVYRKTRSETE